VTKRETRVARCRSEVDKACFHLVTLKRVAKRSTDGNSRTENSFSAVNFLDRVSNLNLFFAV
jgi:hypothetical protein